MRVARTPVAKEASAPVILLIYYTLLRLNVWIEHPSSCRYTTSALVFRRFAALQPEHTGNLFEK